MCQECSKCCYHLRQCDPNAVDSPQKYGSFCGLCSFLVIMIAICLLYSFDLVTAAKVQAIDSTLIEKVQINDPLYLSNSNTISPFEMFLYFTNMTFRESQKYFIVELWLKNITHAINGANNKQIKLKTLIKLTKCTYQTLNKLANMDGINVQTASILYKSAYCLPPNTTIQLIGEYSSQIFSYAQIVVSRCSQKQVCASPDQIDTFFRQQKTFDFNIYFLNTIINYDSIKTVQTFFDSNNYVTFNPLADQYAGNFYFQQQKYRIDNSYFKIPLPQFAKQLDKSDKIPYSQIYSNNKLINFQKTVLNDSRMILKCNLRKQEVTNYYDMVTRKVTSTISNIGGLYSIVAIFAFFAIRKYNTLCFLLDHVKAPYKKKQILSKMRSKFQYVFGEIQQQRNNLMLAHRIIDYPQEQINFQQIIHPNNIQQELTYLKQSYINLRSHQNYASDQQFQKLLDHFDFMTLAQNIAAFFCRREKSYNECVCCRDCCLGNCVHCCCCCGQCCRCGCCQKFSDEDTCCNRQKRYCLCWRRRCCQKENACFCCGCCSLCIFNCRMYLYSQYYDELFRLIREDIQNDKMPALRQELMANYILNLYRILSQSQQIAELKQNDMRRRGQFAIQL